MKDSQRTIKAAFAFLIILIIVFSPSLYSQVIKLSLTSLTDAADLIVAAKVVSVEPSWEYSPNGRNIISKCTIISEPAIKGNAGSNYLVLEIPGGQIGDTIQFITHSPMLTQNEEAILFLRANPLRIIGGGQGKFSVIGQNVSYNNRNIHKDVFLNEIVKYLQNPAKPIELNYIPGQLISHPNSKIQKQAGEEALKNNEPPQLKQVPSLPVKETEPSVPTESEPKQLKKVDSNTDINRGSK